jgi:hypothetical protein
MCGWTLRVSIGVLALVCACGPDEGEYEVDCDADAIVPLLVTADDEQALLVGRTGETWVFEVVTYPMDVADMAASGEHWPSSIGRRFLAVDGCGAEPRSIAERFESVVAPPSAEWPWLAKRWGDGPTTGVYAFDPVEGTVPVRIASDPEAQFLWTTGGVVVIDGPTADPSTLVHVAFDDGGGMQKTTLRDDVERFAVSAKSDLVYERIAFLTTEDQLFVLDVATREERLVRVATLSATSFDAQSRALSIAGGIGQPRHLIDVDGTVDIELIQGDGEYLTSTASSPEFVASMPPVDADNGETQIVWMPELREFRGPGRWLSVGRSEDGAIRMLHGLDAIYRLDADSDEPILVRQGEGYATVLDDRIWVAENVAPTADTPFAQQKMRLLRMQLDGSEPEDLLGYEAVAFTQMDDDLWLVIPDLDERGLGELEAVDLGTGEREPLLDSVLRIRSDGHSVLVDDSKNDALVYSVTPEDPDRNGIWLVHADRLLQ